MENKQENSAKAKLDAYRAKWKPEYDKEQWEKGIIAKYEELKKKEENKTITKEEYKEYKKYEKIKSNIPQIDNLWKYLKDLREYRDLIVNEIETRNQGNQQQAKLEALDKEMQNIKLRIKDIEEEVKNAEGKDKDGLMEELSKYKKALAKNQDEYSKTFLAIQADKKSKNEFSEMSTEQLKEIAENTEIQRSKTKMYIAKLREGMKIDDIKVIVDKKQFGRLKANQENSEKMQGLKDSQRGERRNVRDDIAQTVQGVMEEGENVYQREPSKLPEPVSEFDQKHPRLARIKNWFKDKWYSIKDKIAGAIYEDEEELEESEEKEEQTVEETPRKKFLEQLTIADYDISKVAEMGAEQYKKELDKTEREEKETKKDIDKKEAAKKLMENRKALYGESLKDGSINDRLSEIANKDDNGR